MLNLFAACVDEYIQDQMIVFMALARGESRILTGPLTLHTETAIYIATQLTEAKFCISPVKDGDTNSNVIIKCNGIGYKTPWFKDASSMTYLCCLIITLKIERTSILLQ